MDFDSLVFLIPLAGLFVLPGWCILYLFFSTDELGPLERIPVAFTISLGLFLVVFLVALELAWDWRTVQLMWGGNVIVLSTVAIVTARSRPRPAVISRRFDLPTATLLLVMLIAAGLTLLTPRDEDNWSYFQYVRGFVDATRFQPIDLSNLRTGLNVWWFFHAFLVRTFNFDLIRTGQDYIPLWIVPLSLLTSFALARALGARPWLATLVPLVQLIFFFLDLGYNQPDIQLTGGWVLGRMDQDHTVAGFVFLPVYSMAVVRYLQTGGRRWLGLSFVCLVVLSNVHPQGLVWAGLVLSPFVLIEVFFLPPRDRIRSIAALAPFLIATILILPFIAFWVRFIQTPYFDQTRLAEGVTQFPYHFRWFEFDSRSVFTLRRDLASLPYALGALILLPVLGWHYRQSMAARYLVNTMLILGMALYVPLFFMPLSRLLGYSVFRLWYLLPCAFVICFAAPYVWNWLTHSVRKWRTHRAYRYGIVTLVIIGGLIWVLSRFPDYVRQSPFESLTGHALPSGAHEILLALREQTVAQTVTVLAPREISDPIPSFGTQFSPVVFRYDANPKRVSEVNAFYAASVLTMNHISMLNRYQIVYLIVPTNKQILSQFDLAPSHFGLLRRNRDWVLYRVNQPLDEDAIIRANTHFIEGEWQSAIDAYEQIIANDPANSLAHTGLGMLLDLLGKPNKATQELEQAVRIAPTNQQAHYHLALIYQRLGMARQANEHAHAAGTLFRPDAK